MSISASRSPSRSGHRRYRRRSCCAVASASRCGSACCRSSPTGEGAGLSSYWASGKIATLLDRRRAGTSEDEIRRSVLELALTYHLVSPYTSLVAVDVTPVRPGDQPLESHALRTNLPHGWDYTAVFGLGQGATDAPVHVVLGLVALPARGGPRRRARRVRPEEDLSRRKLIVVAVALLAALGAWELGHGAWIHAKAQLAQYLLQRAWERTLRGEPAAKPWPWADTWPVARLRGAGPRRRPHRPHGRERPHARVRPRPRAAQCRARRAGHRDRDGASRHALSFSRAAAARRRDPRRRAGPAERAIPSARDLGRRLEIRRDPRRSPARPRSC